MGIVTFWPSGSMAQLTQIEADNISRDSRGPLYDLYRKCSLAVLNCGSITDNAAELLDNFDTFEINVIRNERGLKIELLNPPQKAIVDGVVIKTLRNHLCAVLRDIIQIDQFRRSIKLDSHLSDVSETEVATNFIFYVLRHAGCLSTERLPNIAVCWGGHSISKSEYEYARKVGYALGLRGIDICTGCGPGVMEAPMRGALLGRIMQGNLDDGRNIGLTEPSIIAAEPPNPLVTELVILPDIEKRLEAFVRLGHCMLVFPGGPGTAEELLYILSIKMNQENRYHPLPLVLTGNRESEPYFEALQQFLVNCFGREVTRHYSLIIDDPDKVATTVREQLQTVRDHRCLTHDAFSFNWILKIPEMLQRPIEFSHEAMAALDLHRSQEPMMLAANLRAAFSGIVTGNIKENGIREVSERGPFKLHGDRDVIESMAKLMQDFIAQGRISLSDKEYSPCYELVPD